MSFYDHPRMASHPQTLFGIRLRSARTQVGVAQDRLGVMIGLDEGTSSTRISRYETGKHEPPYLVARKIADALSVPVAYFYCPDDAMADLLLKLHRLSPEELKEVSAYADAMHSGDPHRDIKTN